MIKLRLFVSILFFLYATSHLFAAQLYSVKEAVDSTYGIILYEKYNAQVGGEEIRMDDYGIPCENTVIDYYDDGTVLHRGTYLNGTLITYKNYYPDGKPERKFRRLAGGRYSMETFYETGTPRSKIVYYGQDAITWNEYYCNGQVEFTEKYNSRFLLLYRKSFSEDGKPQAAFELLSKRKNIYSHREYYENGAVKEEGSMVFNDDVVDYKREGTWRIYNEKGELIRLEEYVHGNFNSETQASAAYPNGYKVNDTKKQAAPAKLTAEQIDSFFEEEEEEENVAVVRKKQKNTKK